MGHLLHVPQSPESLPSPPTIGCPDVARRRCGGAGASIRAHSRPWSVTPRDALGASDARHRARGASEPEPKSYVLRAPLGGLATGVSLVGRHEAMPLCRCSLLYQATKEVTHARARATSFSKAHSSVTRCQRRPAVSRGRAALTVV